MWTGDPRTEKLVRADQEIRSGPWIPDVDLDRELSQTWTKIMSSIRNFCVKNNINISLMWFLSDNIKVRLIYFVDTIASLTYK